jgi:hypothetical protein
MKSSIFITGVISLLIGATIASPADIDRRQEKAPGVGDKSADVSISSYMIDSSC